MPRTTNNYIVSCTDCRPVIINGHTCHESSRCSGHFTFTNKGGREFHRYTVYSLDVIDTRSGYEINDRNRVGTIMVPADASDVDFVKALKKKDLLNKFAKNHAYEYTDCGFLDYKPQRWPVYGLDKE